MSSIALDIDYDQINNGSIFDELNKICQESPLFVNFKIVLFKKRTKKITKKLIKANTRFVQNIYKYDFSDVKNLERQTKEVLDSLQSKANICESCVHNKKCKLAFNSLYIPLTTSLKNTLTEINKSYHFEANEVFKTEEEFEENNRELRGFSDFWATESTFEEEEFVFKHKAETSNV